MSNTAHLEIRLPIVRGEPTDEDASAAEERFLANKEALAARYPAQYVVVTRDGVIAADPSLENVREQVQKLQRQYGQFWSYLGNPSEGSSSSRQ